MQKLFLHLALLNDEEKLSFIRTALETKSNSEQNKNRESFENCENWKELLSPTRLESENTLCFLRFHFSPIHADDILPIAYFPSKKKKILFCLKIEEEAFRLCKQLGITPKTGEDIFFFIKKRNAFPSQFLGDTLPNEKKRRQKLWFSKNNSRRFLTSGALVLFASLWTPFPHYYLVFSIALFLTSLFVRIWGYE